MPDPQSYLAAAGALALALLCGCQYSVPAGTPSVPPAAQTIEPPSPLTLTPGPNHSLVPDISQHAL